MKKLYLSKFLSIFFILFFSSGVCASGSAEVEKSISLELWDRMSSGVHSFKDLVPEDSQNIKNDFFIPLKMKKIEGARLILFNFDAAERLGIPFPSDPKELEKIVLDRFAYMVDKSTESTAAAGGAGAYGAEELKEAPAASASSPARAPAEDKKTFFATFYQDSTDLTAFLGDGRAVWTGEIKIEKEEDRIEYLDVVIKGIGKTPLVGEGNDYKHNDGLQSIKEGVISFISSEANIQNGIDGTVDLAVISIPFPKVWADRTTTEKACITIRVGKQTRFAHFRTHATAVETAKEEKADITKIKEKKENFKKILTYIIQRDLGERDLGERDLTEVEYLNSIILPYLEMITKNLATETAKYINLYALHGSLTSGNKTTTGGAIDMTTWRYLAEYYLEFKTVPGLSENFENLVEKQLDYIKYFLSYLAKAEIISDTEYECFLKKSQEVFDNNLKIELTKLWLMRLGIPEEISQSFVSDFKNKSLLRSFYDAGFDLLQSKKKCTIEILDQECFVPTYDLKEIFEKAISSYSEEICACSAPAHDVFLTLPPEQEEGGVSPTQSSPTAVTCQFDSTESCSGPSPYSCYDGFDFGCETVKFPTCLNLKEKELDAIFTDTLFKIISLIRVENPALNLDRMKEQAKNLNPTKRETLLSNISSDYFKPHKIFIDKIVLDFAKYSNNELFFFLENKESVSAAINSYRLWNIKDES